MTLNNKQREYAISVCIDKINKNLPIRKVKNYTKEVLQCLFGDNYKEVEKALKRNYIVSDICDAALEVLPELEWIRIENANTEAVNEEIYKQRNKEIEKAKNFIMLGEAKEVLAFIENL